MTRGLMLAVSALTLAFPTAARAQAAPPAAAAEADIKATFRRYDAALRAGDPVAVAPFWADEYVFINPRGERVSREARIANLREKRTSLDSLAHAPQEEVIRTYMDGNMAVYTTKLTIEGRYGGEAERGEFRALVAWIRRDGRWQQLVSQMTPILKPQS